MQTNTVEIIADYHTHTRYSHGTGTVADNVRAALARGLQAVGITDHGPRSWPWIRTTLGGLHALRQEVEALQPRFPQIRILVGVEANVVTPHGDLDLPGAVLEALDLVLVGLHPTIVPPTVRDGWELLSPHYLSRWGLLARARAREVNTRALVQAVLRHRVDVVTHPGWGFDVDTRELARACARRGTALEINAGHGRLSAEYCRVAAREGVLFAIGSDAHSPQRVGDFARALAAVREAGIGPEQVLNARGGPGLRRRVEGPVVAPPGGRSIP